MSTEKDTLTTAARADSPATNGSPLAEQPPSPGEMGWIPGLLQEWQSAKEGDVIWCSKLHLWRTVNDSEIGDRPHVHGSIVMRPRKI